MWDHLFKVYYVLEPPVLSKTCEKLAKEEVHLASISQAREEEFEEMKLLAQGNGAT